MHTENLLYKIAITKIPQVGATNAKMLISYCGGVRAVFEAHKKELLKIPGVGPKLAEEIVNQVVLKEAEAELEFMEQHGVKAYFYLDKDYPRRLQHFPDCPVLLYYKGNADLNSERIVGVVGTRKPTQQGIAICEDLVQQLQTYKPLVISGLAYGIDITAHRKCLELGMPTVGALGHGLDRIYPSSHRSIALKMLEQGGLITEFTHNTLPGREHFPMRNRIIAGLADAIIVVETAERGGSMITAQIANSYNKDVFAVPGRLRDKNAKGCNKLIKTNLACLLESADDIGYIMRWNQDETTRHGKQARLFTELSEKEKTIVALLENVEDVAIDRLGFEANISAGELSSLLLQLEFKGIVKSLPGKRFMLV